MNTQPLIEALAALETEREALVAQLDPLDTAIAALNDLIGVRPWSPSSIRWTPPSPR